MLKDIGKVEPNYQGNGAVYMQKDRRWLYVTTFFVPMQLVTVSCSIEMDFTFDDHPNVV